jgi:hypothetical protein
MLLWHLDSNRVAMLASSQSKSNHLPIRSSSRGRIPRFWALQSTLNSVKSASTRAKKIALSKRNACLVAPSVLSEAVVTAARRYYDSRFADGRNTEERHFGFDLWHIEGSFTAFRTPAAPVK